MKDKILTSNPKPMRRLLHTSDLHLETLGDKGCDDFTSLLKAARKTMADAVIIAGDLFESQRVKEDLIDFVVEGLKSLEAQVIILPGNHDCLTQTSAYNRSAGWKDDSNISIFRSPEGEILRFPDLGLKLWGKPLISYDAEIVPLEGLPQPEFDGCWNIAVAHGFYIGRDLRYSPSYQITHQEIVESGWDYIALGHIPAFNVLCNKPVMACYSGSPQVSGGFLLVNLNEETGIELLRYSESTDLVKILL